MNLTVKKIVVEELPETITAKKEGEWNEEKAGGKLKGRGG